MTREEKILEAIKDNSYMYFGFGEPVYPCHQEEAAAAISQLFDQEMIEFAEFVKFRYQNFPITTLRQTTAELLQIFKNR